MSKVTMTAPLWPCPNCGYMTKNRDALLQEDLESAAWHEAAHAVMRWLCRIPLGPVCIHGDGSGFCAPPTAGKKIATEHALLIAVAGPVGECVRIDEDEVIDYDLIRVPLGDFDYARALLAQWGTLSAECEDATLHALCERAREALGPTRHVVEALASRLMDQYALSQHEVRALFRRWSRRSR